MINKVAFKLGIPNRAPSLLPLLNVGRMKPSFIIAGFQKCGTTTLYELLMSTKTFVPGLMKENDALSAKQDRVEEFKLSFPYNWAGSRTGDASHLYTYSPYGLERVKAHFPDVKVIVIMRNPIDRAYSHFQMDKRVGYFPEALSFEDCIDLELQLRKTVGNPKDPASVHENMSIFGAKYGWALSRGIYHIYLEAIKKQGLDFHPVFLEQLSANYTEEVRKLFNYLEIDDAIPEALARNKGDYEAISKETRSRLADFYAEHNEQLSLMLNQALPW